MTMTPEERAEYERQSKINLAASKSKESNTAIGCISIIVIIILIWGISSTFNSNKKMDTSSTNSISNSISIGSNVIVDNGGENVFLTTNKKDYDEFLKLATAKDAYGIAEMIVQGKLFTVPCKTKSLVIDTGILLIKVRILEGKQAGMSGWIDREFVKQIESIQ